MTTGLDHALEALNNVPPAIVPAVQRCRVCGCSNNDACVIPGAGPCWWVTPNLCSFCADPAAVLYFLGELRRRNLLVNLAPPIAMWVKRAESVMQVLEQTKLEALDL